MGGLIIKTDWRVSKKQTVYGIVTFEDLYGTYEVILWSDLVEKYNNSLQMKILDARPLRDDDEIDPADFMAKTPFDIDHLFHKLLEYKNSIANIKLRQLLDYFFENEKFIDKFKKHPAAKAMHHAYVGGLLEHTVSLAQSCNNLAKVYKKINRDILLAGALLHDIGKVKEMSCDITTEYTISGRLLGHLAMGSEMVAQAARSIQDFPEDLKLVMQHLILSHHGQLDYGSPVLPATPEALALHSLDMLDANLFQAYDAINNEKENDFTKIVYGLDRRFYTKIEQDDSDGDSIAPLAPEVENSIETPELDIIDNSPKQESLL
jgi:3'-5' exoribonuclease